MNYAASLPKLWTCLLISLVTLAVVSAQEVPPEAAPAAEPQTQSDSTSELAPQNAPSDETLTSEVEPEENTSIEDILANLNTYRQLREQLEETGEKIADLEGIEDESAAARREELTSKQTRLMQSAARMRARIKALAKGFEVVSTDSGSEISFSLGEEFQALLRPLITEAREATEPTRELTALNNEVVNLESRIEAILKIQQRLKDVLDDDEIRALTEESDVTEFLEGLQTKMASELLLTRAKLETSQASLTEMRQNRKPVPQQIADGVKDFFAGRGRSLLLATLAAITIFYLLNFAQRKIFRRLGRVGKTGSSFGFRLAELFFTVLRFAAAIAAVFFVFLAFDDWLLVTVTILIALAALWGAKEAMLKGYHKLQLLLNLGPVRQGERVLYNGLPYRVSALSIYPLLENPALTNSTVRITIEELGEMRMRYDGEDEPWFVTEVGDFVLLSDGTYGEVVFQSPDRVKVMDLGGQSKAIPTSDFLSMSPTNLGKGYACAITFGIDYSHQGLDYNEVGRIFGEHARRKLLEFLPEEAIIATFSAFKEAGASSLDYLMVAKLTGAVQGKRPNVLRALSQAGLDACNENGWGIPFPQLTVHKAES